MSRNQANGGVGSSPSVIEAITSSILISNYANANEVCERLRESADFSKNPEVLFLQSRAYLGVRNFQKALETLNFAISSGITNSQFLSLKAQTLLYLGHLSESQEVANAAIAIDTNCIGAYVIKGLALKHLYRDKDALEAFSQGVEAVKHFSHVRNVKLDLEKAFLARCCERYDLAIKYSNYVIEAAPTYSSGYTHLGYNLFAQFLTQRSTGYEVLGAAESSATTPETKTPMPTSSLESEYFARAMAAFDKAISLNSTDSIAIYYKGRLLEETGDTDGALELYHQAAKISAGYANPVLALVNIHMSRAEYGHALEHIETFLETNPACEEAVLAKAKALVSCDRLEEAQSCIESLIASHPDNYYYHYRKALVQYARSDVENSETIKTCEEALRLKPNDIDVLYHKSLVLSSLGNHDEALRTIEKILEIKTDFAPAYQAKGFVLSEVATNQKASGATDDEVMAIEEESLAAHRQAIAQDSNNPMFYSSLASSLVKFHRIDGLNEATEMASRLLVSSSAKHLDPAQREYVRHQVEKKQELLTEVRKLISVAQVLHETLESSALNSGSPVEGSPDEASPEDGGRVLAASSPQRTISHQGSSRHIVGAELIMPTSDEATLSGFSSARRETAELDHSVHLSPRTAHLDSVDSAPPSIAIRRASVDSSTSNFLQPNIPVLYKGGLHSRASDASLDYTERASCAVNASNTHVRKYSEDASDSILATAQRTRTMSIEAIQKALAAIADNYVTSAQIDQLKIMLIQSQQENAQLKAEFVQIRSGLSYAIAHNAEFVCYDADLRAIQADRDLLDYYSGFVNGFQKMFTGYMARSSGAVKKSDGFSIPFKSILPIPHIISDGVNILEAVANFVATIIEDNKEIRALHSVPNIYDFLGNFIPKLACAITMDQEKQKEIHKLKVGHQGLFNLFLMKASSTIYEKADTSRYMELGATDAAKLLTTFTSGQVTLDSLTDYGPTIQTLLRILKDPHFNSSFVDKIKIKLGLKLDRVEEETDEGTDGAETAIDADAEIPEANIFSRNLGAGVELAHVSGASTRVPEATVQQPRASLTKHWYDCFCCCSASSVAVQEPIPSHVHAEGAIPLAGSHNPVGDGGADGTG